VARTFHSPFGRVGDCEESEMKSVAAIAAVALTAAACMSSTARSSTMPRPEAVTARLPIVFEPNRGQADARFDFVSRGEGYTLLLAADEAVFTLSPARAADAPGAASATQPRNGGSIVRMTLVGANPQAEPSPIQQLAGTVNYIRGNDSARWRTQIPVYAKAGYRNVYAGIDLEYYSRDHQLEYDFVVQPGASATAVQLAFDGTSGLEIGPDGDLLLHTAAGTMRSGKPQIYQLVDGRQHRIDGAYSIDGTTVGFEVGAYDASRPLVIDPTFVYTTFWGGRATSMARDASGSVYVTGFISTPDLPMTPGAYDTTHAGSGADAYIIKLDPSGSALEYATYVGGGVSTYPGGEAQDVPLGIDVDDAGNAYVAGYTRSADFPVTPGAFDTTRGALFDGFLVKLNATGSALVYSTLVGGNSDDLSNDVKVDAAGNAYVLGRTSSADFPTTRSGFDTTRNGQDDAFLVKFDAAGAALIYSTYLGGTLMEFPTALEVDSAGSAYVVGSTQSADYPTTPGAHRVTVVGITDIFVTKVNATGSVLDYSTLLGGTESESGDDVAIDGSGNAYVTGQTQSVDFPITPGAFDSSHNGGSFDRMDAFVTKLDPSGARVLNSTFLGGRESDSGRAIAVDDRGNAYVIGRTASPDFPTRHALQDTYHQSSSLGDAFLVKLNATGTTIFYSTFLGGTNSDEGVDIALDGSGHAYVVAHGGRDFPRTPQAFDPVPGGGTLFIAKIAD
jgi:hypothetical protein